MSERVRVERHGAVAWVRYGREPGDLLDPLGLRDLRRALTSLAADPSVRVLIFAGEPGRFPIQLDPAEGKAMVAEAPPIPGFVASPFMRGLFGLLRRFPVLQRALDGDGPVALRRNAFLNFLFAAHALESSDKISIAAIDGPAFGGGMEFALCCDLRFCSDRPDTWLAQPEVLAGVMAGFGATQRLPRLVGQAVALELLLLCEALDPATAQRVGLVNRVLPAATFEAEVDALAQRLARRSPVAVAATKRAVRGGDELRHMVAVWRSEEAHAGLDHVAAMIDEELSRSQRRHLPDLLAGFESGFDPPRG